ncbi:MAG: ribbon-helix-helix domain-containing protein [Candidatus ainarchaeum sp.]|nr:ribbon-helix-helix domain-containing protein [Candidatus ainarchaeum sp.]
MSMVLVQARLPKKLVKEIDKIVNFGNFENKSDFIRGAIRKMVFEEQLKSISLEKSSVKEVREIRKKLSIKKSELQEINSLK